MVDIKSHQQTVSIYNTQVNVYRNTISVKSAQKQIQIQVF